VSEDPVSGEFLVLFVALLIACGAYEGAKRVTVAALIVALMAYLVVQWHVAAQRGLVKGTSEPAGDKTRDSPAR
jgi:hypothetical protein